MEKESIKVGNVYQGVSGCKKKVLGIEGEEGKAKTVSTEVMQQGSGKGNHRPIGTVGRTSLNAFATWAVK